VLGGFAEEYGMSLEHAVRAACAFGGGVAGTAQTCGAVNGALMVLGLAHATAVPGNGPARQNTYAATRSLLGRFRERHGSLECRELLGVDIGTTEGRERAVRDGLFTTRCPVLVRAAAEIVAELVRAPHCVKAPV
jgi:C_GCAxxG_C_C family probable redox protein